MVKRNDLLRRLNEIAIEKGLTFELTEGGSPEPSCPTP
jgi:hypothetical protein